MITEEIREDAAPNLPALEVKTCYAFYNTIITASRTKKKLFILKVDFEKAFDNVRWDYLWEIMRQMKPLPWIPLALQ
ncbi:hypothetical protein OSB04_029106 [Centaurea solstitialis]|uniref:Reverse transcriptase domain-containing protein n=1 Tax=Centaurea solstitialis TaxID=347529 RepID=A0AA38W8D8_9ASTR|nr:hypothetical protein OSB04_029106 [Centaurea solstitialis]